MVRIIGSAFVCQDASSRLVLQEGIDKQTHVRWVTDSYTSGQTIPAYGWWLECVGTGGLAGFGPQPFTYGQASSPGHRLYMWFRYDAGTYGANTWKSEINDATAGTDGIVYANMNNCAGSSTNPFQPTWGQTIAEGPKASNGIVQIPQWSSSGEPSGVVVNSMSFWDARGCTSGGSCTYEKNALNIDQYTMVQSPGNANTGVGLYTSGTDYDVFPEWLNSNYACGGNNQPC